MISIEGKLLNGYIYISFRHVQYIYMCVTVARYWPLVSGFNFLQVFRLSSISIKTRYILKCDDLNTTIYIINPFTKCICTMINLYWSSLHVFNIFSVNLIDFEPRTEVADSQFCIPVAFEGDLLASNMHTNIDLTFGVGLHKMCVLQQCAHTQVTCINALHRNRCSGLAFNSEWWYRVLI